MFLVLAISVPLRKNEDNELYQVIISINLHKEWSHEEKILHYAYDKNDQNKAQKEK